MLTLEMLADPTFWYWVTGSVLYVIIACVIYWTKSPIEDNFTLAFDKDNRGFTVFIHSALWGPIFAINLVLGILAIIVGPLFSTRHK